MFGLGVFQLNVTLTEHKQESNIIGQPDRKVFFCTNRDAYVFFELSQK